MTQLLPVNAVVPTANRSHVLKRTLESLAIQDYQPELIVVVDASADDLTEQICKLKYSGLTGFIQYERARKKGAALQRMQGLEGHQQPFVFFLDDDIILEQGCIERLWNCLQADGIIGGVNAMITNQQYHTPGKISKFMYRLMSGEKLSSYAGKCIGPAWNLLPENSEGLPEYNPVEWLNTTCTLYRRSSLPVPVFPFQFTGYSLMEDVALSLEVGKRWKLFNVRNARIFHDSQPGDHKKSVKNISKMELLNRHYIMTVILGRNKLLDYFKLLIFELFGIISGISQKEGLKNLLPVIQGKVIAICKLFASKKRFEK